MLVPQPFSCRHVSCFCMIWVLFGERRSFFESLKALPFWKKLLEGHFEERLSRDFPEMFWFCKWKMSKRKFFWHSLVPCVFCLPVSGLSCWKLSISSVGSQNGQCSQEFERFWVKWFQDRWTGLSFWTGWFWGHNVPHVLSCGLFWFPLFEEATNTHL